MKILVIYEKATNDRIAIFNMNNVVGINNLKEYTLIDSELEVLTIGDNGFYTYSNQLYSYKFEDLDCHI